MEHPHDPLHRRHITTLGGKDGSNECQVIRPRLANYIARHIADYARMDSSPLTSRITTRSWSTEHFWGNVMLKIIPGVRMLIFLPCHRTSPLPGCRETTDRVHR